MSTLATRYRDAIEHLPNGATLVLRDVAWDEYERLAAFRKRFAR